MSPGDGARYDLPDPIPIVGHRDEEITCLIEKRDEETLERVRVWLRKRADEAQKWSETYPELKPVNPAASALREAAMLLTRGVL